MADINDVYNLLCKIVCCYKSYSALISSNNPANGYYINANNLVNSRDSFSCINWLGEITGTLSWDGAKYVIDTSDPSGALFEGGTSIDGEYVYDSETGSLDWETVTLETSQGVISSPELTQKVWDRLTAKIKTQSGLYATIGTVLKSAAQTGEAATAAATVTTKITNELVEADEYLDITTTPWQIVRHKKGDPTTEYSRKDIKTSDDVDVISDTQIPGKLAEPV